MINLLILLLTSVQLSSCDLPYTVTKVNNQAGIFYQGLGHVKISNDYFTLLSYTNISFYQYKLQILKNLYTQSSTLCIHTHLKQCDISMKLLEIQIPQLEAKFDAISHLVGHRTTKMDHRSKRGLFNGVSYAFSWLFGTPNSDDAEFYSESIKDLFEKNHEVQLLMKQQIHIISDAITNYNESAQSLKINEEKLNENIAKFNKFSKITTDQLHSVSHAQVINDHVSLLTQMSSELNEQYDVIISAILFAKQNTIHPMVISPRSLRNELLKVKLNTENQFPISLNDYNNIHKYFSICELSVVYDNELLIYAIKIPLVNEQVFNLYKLFPLPVPHQNSSIFSYIDPEFPYFLFSTTRTHYGRLRNLSSCKKITQEDYICSNLIAYLSTEKPVCEVLLKDKFHNKIPEDCQTRTILAEMEVWHPLSTNSWLFFMSTPVIATISCSPQNVQIYDVELRGTGILSLQPRCKCFTYNTALTASSNQTLLFDNYLPTISIAEDDCCIYRREFIQNEYAEMEPMNLKNLNLDELRHAKRKLDQFDEILQENITKHSRFYHRSWFSILCAVVIIIALILFCCWKCPCFRHIKKWIFEGRHCCHIPSICINNHNERYELSERQLVRLSNLEANQELRNTLEPVELEPSTSGNPLTRSVLDLKSRRSISSEKQFRL